MKKYYRYELKYLISYQNYIVLRNKLKNIMLLDENANNLGFYYVRSLYFDDYLNTAYYDKLNGIMNRYKYRIRIYNFQDNVIKLQKKIKKGNFSTKIDNLIDKKEYFKFINERKCCLDNKVKDFCFLMKYKRLSPVVIIDYEREAYKYKYGGVRITFDFNLKATTFNKDIFAKDLKLINVLEKNKIILEVKFEKFIPFVIKNIIKNSRINMSISKYVICRSVFI
ncbi:VTC domain-containing protein [Marinitoga hydrogenitolerans DSM 16785]|uniref:VTC domain-containing protein n=1 Tax=Marinitoga hydrogenitolerans (strain DSM 16785 / JCM 12826 / AT1271) TaxID=1122195 RepID=A0A1M4WDG3_MARH1|nr:polyphosphate polymerase domain-containing protein [Marinitoga hydrogenitolerans]SHE79266.1 VTC domain-containing protein [Marinitoga hydrogenitolerans DSM 16785]